MSRKRKGIEWLIARCDVWINMVIIQLAIRTKSILVCQKKPEMSMGQQQPQLLALFEVHNFHCKIFMIS